MKYVRNLLIALIFAALICGGASIFYYSNEYRYSYTDISVNEPTAYSEDNDDLAEFFKRVLKSSKEEEDLSTIYQREPQFYVITHIGGKNQRTYDIYITSVMTRSAYIHDKKADKLYKMNSSAFISFFGREEITPYAYTYSQPCEMTLSRGDVSIAAKATICDWNYIVSDGSFVKVTSLPDGGEVTGSVSGEAKDFTISLPYTPSSIKAKVYTEKDEIIFEGDVSDNLLPCANVDGTVFYEVTAVWNVNTTKDFYGTAKYVFIIENDVPVKVSAENVSCYQGEFMRIFAENANEEDVYTAACPELGYEATFFATENGKISLLPIPCDAVPGIYTINITENGNTRPLEIEVKEQSFDRGTLSISMTRTPEAEAELEVMISPFRTYVSEFDYIGGTFTAPVEGKITTSFGLHRYTNGSSEFTIHNGQDIAARGNPAIRAAQDGVVVYVGHLEIPGKTVVIDHGMNILSYHYHMKNIDVEVGQVVSQGDKLGNMGTTGYSTGDHLHFTVMINGVSTNPVTLYDVDPSAEIIK
ncbi:MAG: M23 family metallopeptidase [Clostridia bacterium]|nr:M23 family metallopeptidase [Clostridia bacterium]